MILDKLLFSNISIIGKSILNDCNLQSYPQNIHEMDLFLKQLKKSIDSNEFKGVLIANILFSFVSSVDIRDRNTTSRTFEDIFSALFGCKCTDRQFRTNPPIIEKIQQYDELCKNLDWKISTDLSGNKREKADLIIDKYPVSLKTLKGPAYSKDNIIILHDVNNELNIGSFSYRALLKGILSDEELEKLSDRKAGLGSGRQLRKNIFNPILNNNKKDEFFNRLKIFLKYVYEEDIIIVLKSHYRIDFILIPNSSFINTILNIYRVHEDFFEKVFYRWENNNLRINWKILLDFMARMEFPYYRTDINLKNITNNKQLFEIKEIINSSINQFLKDNL